MNNLHDVYTAAVNNEQITDDNVFAIMRGLADRFGLAMLVMGRGDVEAVWGDDGNEGEMTDVEWEAVKNTQTWQDGFSDEPLMAQAWEIVEQAATDAKYALRDR